MIVAKRKSKAVNKTNSPTIEIRHQKYRISLLKINVLFIKE